MAETNPAALTARDWASKYTPESGDLVADFYVPALRCAVRYDRSTGFFSAYALALAAGGSRAWCAIGVGCVSSSVAP